MTDLELTGQERRRLEAWLKTTRELFVYRRALALKVDRKIPIVEIARELSVHRASIHRWLTAYADTRELCSLTDRRHGNGGHPRFWSDEAQKELEGALQHSPDFFKHKAVNWTVPLLCQHIETVCGRRPSYWHVRKRIRELDYVWKRPRHALPESESPRVKRRLKLIRTKVRNLPVSCARLFEDETDVLLFPPLRAGWFLRGKPAKVPISGKNAKRTVFGTIDVDTGRRILTAQQGACAIDFQAILRLIRGEYGDQKVALILDKASRHTADGSEEMAAELDIQLIWLPPRCTNVNPMDRLWRWAKDKICANRQHASIQYQADFFIEYLHGLSSQEALRKAGILSGQFWLFN
jgi:transposase